MSKSVPQHHIVVDAFGVMDQFTNRMWTSTANYLESFQSLGA